MPCSQVFTDTLVVCQRQNAASRISTILPDDQSAIVKRCSFIKDITQKLIGYFCIDHRSGFNDIHQRRFFLKYHQRTYAVSREILDRPDDLRRNVLSLLLIHLRKRAFHQLAATHIFQRTPQLRLKHHQDRNSTQSYRTFQQPVDRVQVHQIRYKSSHN